MNRKGFTLIEILAVVTLMAAITLVAIPLILNQVNKSKGKLDDATVEMIGHSTYTYMDRNQSDYPFKKGNVYCITIRTLIDYGDLKEPVQDVKTGEEIPLTTKVKATFESDIDVVYELINSSNTCTEVRK